MGEKTLKQQAAERLAHTYDLPVFPIKPNGKEPAIKDWQQLATRDSAQIRRWWTDNPDYNIGVSTTGLCVVDRDTKHNGPENWRALVDERAMFGEELPKTLEIETWSGGGHGYYLAPEGVEVRSSVGKIAEGVDIRGKGGYVVGPGSTIDGKRYKIIGDGGGFKASQKIAVAPAWLVEQASKARARAENAGVRVTPETEESVKQAWDYVRDEAPEAIEGAGGDAMTHQVAKRLFDFGVTLESAREPFQWWNEHKAIPSWDLDALEAKLEGGMRYRQNPLGNFNGGALPGMEPVEIAEPPVTKRKGLGALWFADAWPRALTHSSKPLVWGLLDEEAFSVTYGESGSGKSFLMLDIAFHIAAGRPWNGHKVKQGAVAYVAAEGGTGIYKRLRALRDHYGIETAPFRVIPSSVDLLRGGDMQAIVDDIKAAQQEIGQAFVYVGIDTVSRVLAGGNENGPEDMGLLVRRFDQLRAVTKAHLNAVHHTGVSNAHRARGHSLLKAATDTEIEVSVVVKDQSFDMKVTKQREAEGGLKMRFAIKPMSLGTDPEGREVKSAVVTQSIVTHPRKPIKALTKAQQDLLDAIDEELADTNLGTGTFNLDFILRAAGNAQLRKIEHGKTPWKRHEMGGAWYQWVRRNAIALKNAFEMGGGEKDEYFRVVSVQNEMDEMGNEMR